MDLVIFIEKGLFVFAEALWAAYLIFAVVFYLQIRSRTFGAEAFSTAQKTASADFPAGFVSVRFL